MTASAIGRSWSFSRAASPARLAIRSLTARAILALPACMKSSFDGEVLEFAAGADGTFVDAQTQSTWNAFGEAIDGELAGSQLNWVHAFPHFWFAWAAFHPDTEVYGSGLIQRATAQMLPVRQLRPAAYKEARRR